VTHVLRDDKGVCGEPSPNWRPKEHPFTRDTKRATCNNYIDMLNEEKESKKMSDKEKELRKALEAIIEIYNNPKVGNLVALSAIGSIAKRASESK